MSAVEIGVDVADMNVAPTTVHASTRITEADAVVVADKETSVVTTHADSNMNGATTDPVAVDPSDHAEEVVDVADHSEVDSVTSVIDAVVATRDHEALTEHADPDRIAQSDVIKTETAILVTLSGTAIAVKENMKKNDMSIVRSMMANGQMAMNPKETLLILKRSLPNQPPKSKP